MLQVTHLSYGYRKGRPVLHDVSMDVAPGATVLLGPNGAGKSTLFQVLAGLGAPWSGEVALGGEALHGDALRSRVALVPQRTGAIPGLTAREQVALHAWTKGASRTAAWDRALVALRQVGLGEAADHKASRLSGGQLARVCLAQALSFHADVLILDEPVAALDPLQRESFEEVLERISCDRVVLVSTHDVHHLPRGCRQVVVLDGGRVRFGGTLHAFLDDGRGGSLEPLEAYKRAVSA